MLQFNCKQSLLLQSRIQPVKFGRVLNTVIGPHGFEAGEEVSHACNRAQLPVGCLMVMMQPYAACVLCLLALSVGSVSLPESVLHYVTATGLKLYAQDCNEVSIVDVWYCCLRCIASSSTT